MIGSQLGSYEILEEIGRGGMGCVYKARQQALDRIVAVKVLLPQLAADKVFVERFLREAKSIATLEHPGIVTIYDVGEADGTYYFAMQLLDGRPLDEVLEEGKPLPAETAVDVLRQVARALDYAHQAGILHRDVKPANIILTEAGQAVLTDFGIAQALSDTRLTKTGSSMGSPEYMAPEQVEGKALDTRGDLYSLGVVFFHMLTGRVPFTGESPVAIVYQHVKAPVPSACEANPKISQELDQITTTLMAKAPEERFASAQNLLQALGPEPTAPTATVEVHRPGVSRWLVGGALAAALGLAGALFWFTSGPGAEGPAQDQAPAVETEAPPAIAPAAEEPGVADEGGVELEPEAPPPPVPEILEVTSEPAGAMVTLGDSTLEQPTPVEVELLPETDYRLRVRLEGYDAAALDFTLDDLTESQRSAGALHFPLQKSIPPGVVAIAADYPVEVRVAGRTYRRGRIELPPGSYEARISAPSVFYREDRRITLESGRTEEIALPPATSITIAANPSRCKVRIDGRDAGYVPAEVRLTLGPHEFEFDWESLGKSLTLTRSINAQTGRVFATAPR